MLTLFALKQSGAYRIAWLLELLGAEYQRVGCVPRSEFATI